jgi:N-acetyl-gamma-glutamyl-phosphate reductase
MLRCGIVGATGYTGIELIKILGRHTYAQLSALTSRQPKPFPVRQLVPEAPEDPDVVVRPFNFSEVRDAVDAVFLCLPHTEAARTAAKFYRAGKIVIDLSADFRLKSARLYEAWYGVRHAAKNILGRAVYGLPEMNREAIRSADLIANPGCYPTGAVIGLYPLLKRRLIDPDSIVIDAKSGVTGAGKRLSPHTQFCAVDENFYAYKVNRHQHMPEIEQALGKAAGRRIAVTFVPHLLPMKRGIMTALYLKVRKGAGAPQIARAFGECYGEEPFVRFRGEGQFPALADVQGTNFCDVGFSLEKRNGRLIVITAIDNLLKGASGQAVQNMNIRAGFPEHEGLKVW